MNRSLRFTIPLVLFILVAVFLAWGLREGYDPRHIPSPLIGKSVPAFSLPSLEQADTKVTNKDLLGKVYLLNVWATWCISCRAEHPVLVDLARSGKVDFVGLIWKDERDKAAKWLHDLGNPYSVSILDKEGRTAIDLGVYGAPETFLVDQQGVIRYKHAGPITRELFNGTILPLIEQLKSKG
jgi:cytochrome c biogenesis protein CcmG, thiol:disulfide interchange protein DsbE